MDVIEITRQLGAALQKEPVYAEYHAARKVLDGDQALQGLIGEFNLLRMQLTNELQKEDDQKSDSKVQELNSQLQKIYGEIMQNENMEKFNIAKKKMDELTTKITSIIAMSVEGEDPATCEPASHDDGCTGSCSTCGGCH